MVSFSVFMRRSLMAFFMAFFSAKLTVVGGNVFDKRLMNVARSSRLIHEYFYDLEKEKK